MRRKFNEMKNKLVNDDAEKRKIIYLSLESWEKL